MRALKLKAVLMFAVAVAVLGAVAPTPVSAEPAVQWRIDARNHSDKCVYFTVAVHRTSIVIGQTGWITVKDADIQPGQSVHLEGYQVSDEHNARVWAHFARTGCRKDFIQPDRYDEFPDRNSHNEFSLWGPRKDGSYYMKQGNHP